MNLPSVSHKPRNMKLKSTCLHFKKHKKTSSFVTKINLIKQPIAKSSKGEFASRVRNKFTNCHRRNNLKTTSTDLAVLTKNREESLDSVGCKIRKLLQAKAMRNNTLAKGNTSSDTKKAFLEVNKQDIVLPVNRDSRGDRENYTMRRTNILDIERGKKNAFYSSLFMNKVHPIEVNYVSTDGKKRTSYFCFSPPKPNRSLEVISLELKKTEKISKKSRQNNLQLSKKKSKESPEMAKSREVNKLRTLFSCKKSLKANLNSEKKLNNSDNESVDSNSENKVLKPVFAKTFID